MSAAKVGTSISWFLIAFLSLGVAGYAMFLVATGYRFVPEPVIQNHFPSLLGIEVHIAAASVALLMGPFQFLKSLRSKYPSVHRWMGRTYVAACLTGGLAGGSIALFSTSGPIAGWGFFCLALTWLVTTGMAFTRALQRNFIDHERWMIRSFATTLAAVTLRIYLPIAVIENQGEFPVEAYRVIAWACWIPNLIIAELWIASRRRPRRAKPASATNLV